MSPKSFGRHAVSVPRARPACQRQPDRPAHRIAPHGTRCAHEKAPKKKPPHGGGWVDALCQWWGSVDGIARTDSNWSVAERLRSKSS